MRQKTIAQLQQLFRLGKLTQKDIKTLQTDPRQGVQNIIASFNRQKEEHKIREANFFKMTKYEQALYAQGHQYVAGVDEAGRGPLAGPVVAAAVILPSDFKLLGLNDSKQLSQQQLHEYYHVIKKQAVSLSVAMIDNEQIDRINIYQATKLAMEKAIGKLQPSPSHVLIDAVPLEHLPYTSDIITKGDQKSISIAAASIIAKVTRDQLMKDIHKKYPIYHFNTNMGYGTKHHITMLKKHGLSPVHRRSYTPVKRAMNR